MSERFPDVARRIRQEARVSLRQLAKELGWTPAYVSDIERGQRSAPDQTMVRRWAKAIGADPDYLARLAAVDTRSIELSVPDDSRRSRLAVLLARGWDHMSDERVEELMRVLGDTDES